MHSKEAQFEMTTEGGHHVPVDMHLPIEKVTARQLVDLPAEAVAVIPDFDPTQTERLQDLMAEAFDLVAANHRAPGMGAAKRLLMVPVVYVLGHYPDLGPSVIGRITAAGVTFIEREDWPRVRSELDALYR